MDAPTRSRGPHGPRAALGRRIVEFARRAPSVHNTQPWAWRIGDGTLDLYADRARQLPVADPDGRLLTISCGAALHYALAAAAAAGRPAEPVMRPNRSDPDLLASIRLPAAARPAAVTREATAHAELLAARATDRRRFIGWPIPSSLLQGLTTGAAAGGASAVPLPNAAARVRVELLMSRAMATERSDPRFAAELGRWTHRASDDGVPRGNAVPPAADGLDAGWPSRFGGEDGEAGEWTLAPRADGIVVIVTAEETPAAWLAAGDVLCRLWADAMAHDLSLVPLSEIVEVAETREVLHGVVGAAGYPALVVRIGWQEISRSALPRTPRRPLEDLLRT
ncbi:Acg family FMN-binding oxidoreductase [Nocardioides mangrovi]|uniref:NAD(P)H nitroreductase n=1 Tax=Nocardioides mangrovi TaxID=2874580 RepID=A0ABS7U7J0_9ACTN|nr:hypothetical protein [Nocardioides mangrovi]MBZ5736954.1 hypothetical protein [Nocardioides mangrovi]